MQYGEQYRDARPEAVVEAMREQARQAMDIRQQLAEIVGEATSEDGYVTAVVGPRGLQELTFEPRAMRMASEDLARSVVTTTQLATEDFNTRRAEKAAELGASTRPSLEESLAHLDRLNEMVRSGHQDAQSVFQRFRTEVTGER